MRTRGGHASEIDLDAPGDWQLVTAGGRVEVVHVAAPGFTPASPGDVWDYCTTQPGQPPLHSRDRVLAARQQGDLWIARMGCEIAEVPAARCERDLVIAADGLSPDIGTMTSAAGPVRTTSTRGLYLPRALPVGLRWRWAQQLEMPLATMEVTGTGEVVSVEQVTVPAGSFEAVRVHGEVVSRVVLRSPAGSPPIESVQRDTSYWVRGLGLVRSVSVGPPEQQRDKVLVAYEVRGASARQARGRAV